ncbi:hypothetical protein BBAD15_g5118 [Beauveria bassiana D1-5]|uniref:Uncharacterized protein n=1 Tax=Beauveria bassiana D1-5 TaxID=1245745 RepID=A0A0A2VPJ5_BEABA|nr:hypothetical protein BBAD15_g5118 [Beauveria bassiana D1-5]
MAPLTVHSHMFPRDGVQLGRLVTNVKLPHSSYYPQGKQSFLKGDIYSVVNRNFHHLRSNSRGTVLEAVFTRLASLLFRNTSDLEAKITNTICVTYYLDSPDGKFASMCKSKAARAWFEDAYRKRKVVYMVTGIQTLTDANMELSGTATGKEAASLTVPVSGVSDKIATVDVIDPRLSAERHTERHRETGFVAEGEQIYAIQYRKIKFNLFSAQNMDEAYLEEGNRWEVMWKTMGANDKTNILEVKLVDLDEPIENIVGISACTIAEVDHYFITDLISVK